MLILITLTPSVSFTVANFKPLVRQQTAFASPAINRLAQLMAQEAKKLNNRAPFLLDEVTRIDKVTASGLMMTSYYTLLTDISREQTQDIRASLINDLCDDAATQIYLEQGASYHLIYRDMYESIVLDILICRETCRNDR